MTRSIFKYHPVIGHTFISGLRTRNWHESGGFLIRTNEAGFRSEHEFVREKAPGIFRMLLFGDSFPAGHGVSNPQRFGDLLEQRIEGLEVYNFGLNGTGPDQQYLIFREFAADLEYDLIMFTPWLENIARSSATHQLYFVREQSNDTEIFARPYFRPQPDGTLELRGVPVRRDPVPLEELQPDDRLYPYYAPQRFARLRKLIYRMGPRVTYLARRLARSQAAPEYEHDPAWVLMRAILEQWISEARAPFLMAPIPLLQHIEEMAQPSGYVKRFQELADPPRVLWHDLLPDLRSYPMEQRRAFRFPLDIHPTPEGHRALADSLEPALRALIAEAGVAVAARAREGGAA